MFIRIKKTPNSPRKALQIVETFRDNGKVKQRIVHHVGVIRDEQHEAQLRSLAEFIKAKLESEGTPEQMFSPEEMAQFVIDGRELIKKQDESLHAEESIPIDLKNIREEQRITVGIHEVYGEIYEELNLGTILENPHKFKTSNQLLKDITLLRIANPQSKKSSVQDLLKNYGLQLNLTSVYNMMNLIDHKAILRIKENAKAQAVKLFGEEIQILYYDCTTLYFESFEEDQLRQKGFSEEHQLNETQIVLALAVTKEGIPIDYEVFAGSTSEGTTMQTVLERLKGRWEQSKIRLVADSALLTQKNITWLEQHQIEYILGGKPKAQKFLLKEKILTWSDTLDKTKNALTQFNLEDGRIMHVSYSAKRAQKDNKQRLSALEKLKKKLEKSHSTKSFINGGSSKKFLNVINESQIELSEDKIKTDARWDGLHAVITSIKDLSSEEVYDFYHGLWQVEETFRISKHDLSMRPIFHYKSERIHAHIAICFMALLCVRHLEYRAKVQKPKLSLRNIRGILLSTQISVIKDISTDMSYAIPSKPTSESKQLYSLVGKTLSSVPFSLGKLKR